MSAENTQAQSEQIPPNLNNLNLTFAKVCFDYGALVDCGIETAVTNRLTWLISDLEKMSLAAKELYNEISGGAL